ncbi:hypothetical protein HanRHA438_Chr15g0719711 [Helianthus annuus]|nr:hypothetical protein HanRHA438_Chr15g0719711 [Helianthus annuus]
MECVFNGLLPTVSKKNTPPFSFLFSTHTLAPCYKHKSFMTFKTKYITPRNQNNHNESHTRRRLHRRICNSPESRRRNRNHISRNLHPLTSFITYTHTLCF